MSTTTLKLPEELKERIAAAAADAGKSPHAFMVEALAAQTGLAERRRVFVARGARGGAGGRAVRLGV